MLGSYVLLPFALLGVYVLYMLFYLFTHTGVKHDFHIRRCFRSLTVT